MRETLKRPQPKSVRLQEVAENHRHIQARALRADAHQALSELAHEFGPDFGGYSLTVFNRRGCVLSAFNCAQTPFDRREFPGRVHSALNQMIAASLPKPNVE